MAEKDVLEKAMEFEQIEEVEKLVKNNEIEFIHKDITYKVTRPTLNDKEKIRQQRLKKIIELKANPDILTRDQVVKAYNGTEDDIATLDQQMIQLRQQMDELCVRGHKERDNEHAVANLEEKFKEMESRFYELSEKKTELLQGTLESELNLFCIDYLTFLVLYKIVDEKYVRVFDKFEDYQKVNDCDTETLLGRASVYANYLISMNVF